MPSMQDFSMANEGIVDDKFQMPESRGIMDNLHGKKWFSSFDAKHGYWQQGLHPNCRDVTSFFSQKYGLLRWCVSAQGLKNCDGVSPGLQQYSGITMDT